MSKEDIRAGDRVITCDDIDTLFGCIPQGTQVTVLTTSKVDQYSVSRLDRVVEFGPGMVLECMLPERGHPLSHLGYIVKCRLHDSEVIRVCK